MLFFSLFLCKISANCLLTQILSGTKLLQFFEMGKFFRILLLFCHIHITKIRKTCYKTYFFVKIFGGNEKKQYLCTVFFMVLDLRLSKDWVVGMTILLFFILLTSFCYNNTDGISYLAKGLEWLFRCNQYLCRDKSWKIYVFSCRYA